MIVGTSCKSSLERVTLYSKSHSFSCLFSNANMIFFKNTLICHKSLIGYYLYTSSLTGTGSEFYFGSTRNLVLLMITELQPVSFYIEIPGIGFYYSATITASNQETVKLPENAAVSSPDDQDKGIYLVTSSDRVTVIGSHASRHHSLHYDTFLAFSISHECFSNYAYYWMNLDSRIRNVAYYIDSILIVGTEDSTMMKLTVTQPATIKVDDTDTDLTPGRQFSFMINRLQTVYVGSVRDMTGIKIITNKPVSVFSTILQIHARSGQVITNLTEQVPPTTSWGRLYYTTSVSNVLSNTIQVLAAYNSTNVDIYCNDIRRPHTISEGGVIHEMINSREYCAIYSSKEILVVQFESRISFLGVLLVPSSDYFNHKFLFKYPIMFFENFVNIIVLAQYYQPDMIYLISGGANKSLDTQEWVPVKVNNVTKAYGTIVTFQSVVEIIHTNPSALMTTTVNERYGHVRGFKHHKGLHFVFSTKYE